MTGKINGANMYGLFSKHSRPISIGVSGAWGVGKSSMIRLVRRALVDRAAKDSARFVFVQFNAWLYQAASVGSSR